MKTTPGKSVDEILKDYGSVIQVTPEPNSEAVVYQQWEVEEILQTERQASERADAVNELVTQSIEKGLQKLEYIKDTGEVSWLDNKVFAYIKKTLTDLPDNK